MLLLPNCSQLSGRHAADTYRSICQLPQCRRLCRIPDIVSSNLPAESSSLFRWYAAVFGIRRSRSNWALPSPQYGTTLPLCSLSFESRTVSDLLRLPIRMGWLFPLLRRALLLGWAQTEEAAEIVGFS